ncbi:MAG: ferritin-like domain-containing protein [Thermomicrobiales bacterium]
MATSPFKDDVDVLNYALTLEHLEATFYKEALKSYDEAAFTAAGYQPVVRENVAKIADDEKQHVDALTAVIKQLKGKPVKRGKYDFKYTDLAGFLKTAAVIEGVGVSAYGGAAQYIENKDILTAALTIHGVEGRHAAYLNVLTGAVPFPDAVNAPLSKDEVLKAAGPFITG